MQNTRQGHPLVESLSSASAQCDLFALPIRDDDEGWIDATTMFEKDNLEELRQLVLTQGQDRWGSDNPHVAGSAFIIAYLTRVTWPLISQYVLTRRVPKATLDNLSLHRDGVRIVGTAINYPYFAALPGDPEAEHRDAIMVADEQQLYQQLKEWLFEDNLNRVIPVLRQAAGASVKVSQNAVAAACAQVFNRLYRLANDPDRVAQEAEMFFADASSSIYGEVSIEVFAHAGKQGLFSRRRGCCLWWRTERASGYCSNCVLVTREQQDCRFRQQLVEYY